MPVIQFNIFSSGIYKIKIEGISQTGQFLLVHERKDMMLLCRSTFLIKLLQREFYPFINHILELPPVSCMVRQEILVENWNNRIWMYYILGTRILLHNPLIFFYW
jgi:hypothetical protein